MASGRWRGYHVVAGHRRIGVHLLAIEPDEGSCHAVAVVRLPPAVRDRFDACVVRAVGLSHLGSEHPGGRQLALESVELDRRRAVKVTGGTDLAWRQLFDPALVDLLGAGLRVEWSQEGDTLVVTAPCRGINRPDSRALDTVCVAAVAIERRFAAVAVDGGAARPAPFVRPGVSSMNARRSRHLADARARDLELAPEELFGELARYADAAEVATIRARVEAGTFPLEHLDDLVHHRRAQFWQGRSA